MFTGRFWKAASERATKTAAQSALLAIGADQVNVLELDFATLGGFAAGGAVLSILTSIASVKIGHHDGPSLSDGERVDLTPTV